MTVKSAVIASQKLGAGAEPAENLFVLTNVVYAKKKGGETMWIIVYYPLQTCPGLLVTDFFNRSVSQ